MPENGQQTAILFFSLSAQLEGEKKLFVSEAGKNKQEKIAHVLIDHTRKVLQQSGLPIVIIDETKQNGTTFGERFANAFEQVFNQGYDYVVAVGNDTPGLTVSDIHQTVHLLKKGQAGTVLGPASDGGTWLMGYTREVYERSALNKLPWQTEQLFDKAVQQAKTISKVEVLQGRCDIDSESSLNYFIRGTIGSPLLRQLVWRLRTIIGSKQEYQIEQKVPLHLFFNFLQLASRAPPCSV